MCVSVCAHVSAGAAVWDGAYVLAAYLDSQPPGTFAGLRCVELGCGCGLLGLVLARLGAGAVYLTDKQQHLVGPRVNAAKNKLLAPAAPAVPAAAATAAAGCGAAAGANGVGSISTAAIQQQQGVGMPAAAAASSNGSSSSSSSPAVVQVVPLDWEDSGGMAQSVAAITAAGPIDLIVASDCIYPGTGN
jgi:predicted nicotinamide N-methyase